MTLKAITILHNKGYKDANGNWVDLTSAIDHEEAMFLSQLVKDFNPQKTLEIGCAEGISSLAICESLGSNAHHTILDPFQSTQWKSSGINNLKAEGFKNFTLIEERSELALPQFLKEGKTFDFVFVDGWHTLDHVMVEFFYINRLLPVGGVVAFDDIALTGLNKLMRYISNYPNYKCVGSVGETEASSKRKMLNSIKKLFNGVFFFLPANIKKELLNDTVVRSDEKLQLNASVIAFQKTAEDDRGWAWYEMF
jgi:predicted O-methyltransferase YrrM